MIRSGGAGCAVGDKRIFWEQVSFYFHMANPSLQVVTLLQHIAPSPGNYWCHPCAAGVGNPQHCTGWFHNSTGCPAPPLEANRYSGCLQNSTREGEIMFWGCYSLQKTGVHGWVQHKGLGWKRVLTEAWRIWLADLPLQGSTQSHIAHNSVSFVLFFNTTNKTTALALFWQWYCATCEKWEQVSLKRKSATHQLQA